MIEIQMNESFIIMGVIAAKIRVFQIFQAFDVK